MTYNYAPTFLFSSSSPQHLSSIYSYTSIFRTPLFYNIYTYTFYFFYPSLLFFSPTTSLLYNPTLLFFLTPLFFILLHLFSFLNCEHLSFIYSYTLFFLTPLFFILLHFSFPNTSLLYIPTILFFLSLSSFSLFILFFYIYFSNTSDLHCSTLSSVSFYTSVLITISLSSN